MNIKARIKLLELRSSAHPKTIRVIDPELWPDMSPKKLEAHRDDVRQVLEAPNGVVICLRDEGDPDPLELLLTGDEVLAKHRRTIKIERSYGHDMVMH
ncbi:MAG: hypothetical protein ACOYLM_13440 [Methylococcaceae bacterium]